MHFLSQLHRAHPSLKVAESLAEVKHLQLQFRLRDVPGQETFADLPCSLCNMILAAQSLSHTFGTPESKQLKLTQTDVSGRKTFQKHPLLLSAYKLCTTRCGTEPSFSDRHAITLFTLAARLKSSTSCSRNSKRF